MIPGTFKKLSRTRLAQGDTTQAIAFAEKAIEIERGRLSKHRSAVHSYLAALASLYFSAGESAECLTTLNHLINIRRSFLEGAFSYASEEQKIRYCRKYSPVEHLLLSLAETGEPEEAVSSALRMVLHAKAFVLDALSAEREVAFCEGNERVAGALDSLPGICGNIATLALDGDRRISAKELSDSLDHLRLLKNKIEAEISQLCSEYEDALATKEFTVEDVAQSLPERSVLWEFIRYDTYDFRASDQEDRWDQPRYVVFILNSAGEIDGLDLGEASVIDSPVAEIRSELSGSSCILLGDDEQEAEMRLREISAELHALVFASLVGSAEQAYHILIYPDGQLSLLPFEILSDENGTYVLEDYRVSYLSSGRDLLKLDNQADYSEQSALLIYDPDYESEATYTPTSPFASSVNERQPLTLRDHRTRRRALPLRSIPFGPRVSKV